MSSGYSRPSSARGTRSLLSTLRPGPKHVDESSQPLLSADAQIQNVKSANVYVFGDADLAEDEVLNEDAEVYELRPRVKSRQKPKSNVDASNPKDHEQVFLEIVVTVDDTLQSIALKYGCRVSELKRANNLIKDQDFFALSVVKVPVKRHGLLTEIVDEQNRKESRKDDSRLQLGAHGGACAAAEADNNEGDGGDSEPLVRTLSIRGALSSQGLEAQEFLQQMDTDIKKIVSSTNTSKDTLEEVTESLTCKRFQPLHRQGSFAMWGADYGMRWKNVVAMMLLILFVTPLIIFIYEYIMYTKQENGDS